jgi:hypothetical protein
MVLGIFNFIPVIRIGSSLASKLHELRQGEGDVRTERTATMLDTALLIASALSLALMVAFSELP